MFAGQADCQARGGADGRQNGNPRDRRLLHDLEGRAAGHLVHPVGERHPTRGQLLPDPLVDPVVPPAALAPDAPDAFRFAAPGNLQAVVAEAGAAHPVERLFRFSIDVPLSPEGFWNLRMEMSEKLRERLATVQPDLLDDLKRPSIAPFHEYSSASGLSFPAEVLLVSARK